MKLLFGSESSYAHPYVQLTRLGGARSPSRIMSVKVKVRAKYPEGTEGSKAV